MKMTTSELRLLRIALEHGIQWEMSLADAWTPQFGKIPADARALIRRSHSQAKRMKALLGKVNDEIRQRTA
jgi:hypothetical protein